MSRRLKQVIYGTFYLVFFALLGTSIYFLFLKPAPSCFDGKQNGIEEGIDCGLPACGKICLPSTLRDIAVLGEPNLFSVDDTHSTLLVALQNSNLDYAAKSFRYEAKLYDKKGVISQTFSGNSFIYAGELKYIALPNIFASKADVGRIEFAIQNPAWVQADVFRKPQLMIQDQKASISGSNLLVEGRLVNQDTLRFSKVEVVVLFQGKLGQPVGASVTELDNMFPNETRSFTLTHPAIPDVVAAVTKVFLYAERQ